MPMFSMTYNPDDFSNALKRVDHDQVQLRTQAAMLESLAFLQQDVVQNTPGNLGLLRNSIQPNIRGEGINLRGVLAPTGVAASYAYYVEEGRKPGGKQPPRAAIEPWTARVLGDASLWFVVARSIARKGITGKHMFRNAAARGQSVIASIFRKHFTFS